MYIGIFYYFCMFLARYRKLIKYIFMYRSHTCGELRSEHIGQNVTLAGWVQKVRNLGAMTFIDLRDRYGITQIVVEENSAEATREAAARLGREFVLQVTGKVIERSSKNPKMPTGDIEVAADEIKILNEAQTPPFTIEENSDGGDDLRMKYRYLDLRRPPLQRNMELRHRMAHAIRTFLDKEGFLEIETPYLVGSTPEGARDFVVPSRMNPNQFYALPQSPQTLKQLLMVAGYDRYFQIVRCFRDEDLRADRQPEFTQIDLEMSFVDVDDILSMIEGYVQRLFKEIKGIDMPKKLPRLTYKEAMERYGSDKPDTRFGMEITNLSEIVKSCGFGVFTSAIEMGGSVRAICVKGGAEKLTRKEIDKLTEFVRGIGAKGLAFIRWVEDTPACSFAKFMSEEEMSAILGEVGAQKGDVVLIVADKDSVTLPTLGALRVKVGKELNMIPDGFNLLWITEFPFFEWNEETESWDAMHHPFTMPLDECLEFLDSDPGNVRAKAYDLVANGVELCSGSIRITDFELQKKMFESLGLTDEEIRVKFGFLVDAYKYASPPHGGAGIGLDRLAMILSGAESLRDVLAFPKVQNASELMSACPSPVDKKSLDDLSIAVIEKEEK